MSSYNLPCVTQSLFHIYTLCCFWLTRGTGEFFKGKAKRCFRDWPFVYFSGGFISHLFGDYANINLWNQIIWRLEILLRTIVAALLKTKCNGRYVKNKGYQETGKEYFAIVHMIEKDEGYKYFAAWATFDARSCLPSPPSAPHTHKVTLSANKKDTACLMTSAHPTSSPHNLISNFHHDKCTSFLINCPNRKGNLFHKSWNFIWTEFNCAYIQQVQEIDTNLMHNMNELAPRALWFFLSGL